MVGFRSYVICTTPRSGSTLLCKLLAATGKAGDPDSLFHNPSISDWLGNFDLSPAKGVSEREVLAAIFEAARVRGGGGRGLFGLRLQRKSFGFLIRQIDILHPGLASDRARFQAAFGDTLFIHLTRANKLEQAISFVKATQTGLWHRAPDGHELERLSDPQDPVYDADEIARHLADLTALDLAWQEWFAKERIDPLRVTYNALAADPSAIIAGILDGLGLDPGVANDIRPAVAKLADATSRRWAERFVTERGADAANAF